MSTPEDDDFEDRDASESGTDWVQTSLRNKGDDVYNLGLHTASTDARDDVNARLHSGQVYDGETFSQDTPHLGSSLYSKPEDVRDRSANEDAPAGTASAPTNLSEAGVLQDALSSSDVQLDNTSPGSQSAKTDAGVIIRDGAPVGSGATLSAHPDQAPSMEAHAHLAGIEPGPNASAPTDGQTGDDRAARASQNDESNESEEAEGSLEREDSQDREDGQEDGPDVGGGREWEDNHDVDEGTGDAESDMDASTKEDPKEITLALTPTRPEMPLDVAQPGETVTLTARLAGEAYKGDPAYEILVDGEVVAQGIVDWARETTTDGKYQSSEDIAWRDVSVDLQVPVGGFESVEVRFPNDAYKRDVGDRNLLVDKITIDDIAYEAEADETVYHGGKFADGASQERMPWRGTLEFDVSDMAEHADPLPAPEGAYVIENVEGASVGTLDLSGAQLEDLTFTLSDDRFEVVGYEVKLKDGISLDHEEIQSLSLEVSATDGEISSTTAFDVAIADVPEPVYTVVEGTAEGTFTARYFDVDHKIRELADINWDVAPTHEEGVSAIDYENGKDSFWDGGSKDTFGVQITGQIDVPEDGAYSFTLGADDGAMLFIDGQPVIDNDGLHSFKSETVEVELEPGPHSIEVIYFENHGRAGLSLEWDGPSLDGPLLVTPMDMEEAKSFEGVALGTEVTLEHADELVSIHIDGLPGGFMLTDGDKSATSGSDPVSLEGWDLSNLQITPPLGFQGEVNAVVEGSDGGLLKSIAPVSFEVVGSETALMPPMVETGFRVEFFEEDSRLRRLEDVDFDASPAATGVYGAIDFAKSRDSFWEDGAKDQFAVRATGDIEITEGGLYDFRLASDDGAKLFINGEEVVDNDGLHGFRNRDGDIALEPGVHEVEILYFENTGHAGLRFEYSGPDTGGDMSIVPAVTEPTSDGTQPADLSLNLNSYSELNSVNISDMPSGTWLSDGTHSMLIDEGSADITDWDHGALQITPPEGYGEAIEALISVQGSAFNGATVTHETTVTIDVVTPQNAQEAPDQSLWDSPEEHMALGGQGADTADFSADLFESDQPEDDASGEYAYG